VQNYVLFEDDGDLKAGTVRSATDASLQVDSTSGKRLKVKAAAVLLRFDQPRAEDLLAAAQAGAAGMDTDFLWQCAPQQEFGFEQLAGEYFGRVPTAVESAAILLRLQSAPVYFQRKGRGRFRPAAPEVLRAALAAVERRRLQEEQRAKMVQELASGILPAAIAALGSRLLTRPDKNSIEYKALDQVAHAAHTSPLRLLLARGAIASPYEWHVESFLARAFPQGVAFAADLPPPPAADAGALARLPLAPAPAFSIDDSATTEIDDAFSVHGEEGRVVVGVHIAAPSLGIAAGDALDALARARMSTVYAPGLKYTMLPPAWIEAFSLVEGRTVPALSLYLELDPATLALRGTATRVERVRVAANLRYDLLDAVATEEALAGAGPDMPHGAELGVLWRFAGVLRAERERVRGRPEPHGREEVSLQLDGEGAGARVRRYVRRRDAPLDRIVAELMICANRCWGAWLEQQGLAGIYRSQSLGRVRMATVAAPHEGLGVSHYAWCTSPLRRYVDLLNQRQLLAAAGGAPPPHRRGDADLFAIVSAFDAAYSSYAEFQQTMEIYWSLRWLQQEEVRRIEAVQARGGTVRLRGLPMNARVAGAADLPRGQRVLLELGDFDLVELTPNARIVQLLAQDDADGAGELDDDPDGEPAGPAQLEEAPQAVAPAPSPAAPAATDGA
jgi:exoribonuclease-2